MAAERTSGQGSILGAQDIRSLWRIYPATKQARTELLIKAMSVRGFLVQVSDVNPFVLRENTGEEKPATKLWISDLPLSVANSEIEHSLTKLGLELRSDIKQERYRDIDNKLTRFETGRRFVFVTVPSKPLDPTLTVSFFVAKVYHKEQKLQQKSVMCSKCLTKGHHASMCENDVVCRACHKPGHKQGSEVCSATSVGPAGPANNTPTQDQGNGDKQANKGNRNADRSISRGRAQARQSTLHSSLTRLDQRQRSQTPKRPRSGEDQDGGKEAAEKQRRQRGREDTRNEGMAKEKDQVEGAEADDIWSQT